MERKVVSVTNGPMMKITSATHYSLCTIECMELPIHSMKRVLISRDVETPLFPRNILAPGKSLHCYLVLYQKRSLTGKVTLNPKKKKKKKKKNPKQRKKTKP